MSGMRAVASVVSVPGVVGVVDFVDFAALVVSGSLNASRVSELGAHPTLMTPMRARTRRMKCRSPDAHSEYMFTVTSAYQGVTIECF